MIRVTRIKKDKDLKCKNCNVRTAKLSIKFENIYSDNKSLDLCLMCAGAFTLDLKRVLQSEE